MTPEQWAEIEAVARHLDEYGLQRSAARLRALSKPADDLDEERPFAIQDEAKQVRAIPWGLAAILYPAYGYGQTLERLDERGGFGRVELGLLACDSYAGGCQGKPRPRLKRMPLLDLYEMAKR